MSLETVHYKDEYKFLHMCLSLLPHALSRLSHSWKWVTLSIWSGRRQASTNPQIETAAIAIIPDVNQNQPWPAGLLLWEGQNIKWLFFWKVSLDWSTWEDVASCSWEFIEIIGNILDESREVCLCLHSLHILWGLIRLVLSQTPRHSHYTVHM